MSSGHSWQYIDRASALALRRSGSSFSIPGCGDEQFGIYTLATDAHLVSSCGVVHVVPAGGRVKLLDAWCDKDWCYMSEYVVVLYNGEEVGVKPGTPLGVLPPTDEGGVA